MRQSLALIKILEGEKRRRHSSQISLSCYLSLVSCHRFPFDAILTSQQLAAPANSSNHFGERRSRNVCDSIFFKSECCDLVLVVLVVCSSGSSANDATLPAPVALPARPVTVVLVVVVVPVVVVQVLCQLDLSQSGAASLCSATLACCSTHWSSAAQGCTHWSL